MSDSANTITAEVSASSSPEAAEAFGDMEFLDDVDFTLEDVESKIAPLALAHV